MLHRTPPPPMPSGACMEIHTNIMQRRNSYVVRGFLGNPKTLYRLMLLLLSHSGPGLCTGEEMKVEIRTKTINIYQWVVQRRHTLTLLMPLLLAQGPSGGSSEIPLMNVRLLQTAHPRGLCDSYMFPKMQEFITPVQQPSPDAPHHLTEMLSSPTRHSIVKCGSNKFMNRLVPVQGDASTPSPTLSDRTEHHPAALRDWDDRSLGLWSM